ncbi:MAG: HutD family protein [Pseudomonadota bacterium]
MIHLTAADYRRQPWKNGRGVTTELLHIREPDGRTRLRLSRASVTEDGPFSVFPGIARNLTVLSGPGFRLSGSGMNFRCDPLVPVAFPGDIELTASETNGRPSDDFNVMIAESFPMPQVLVARDTVLPPGEVMVYALGQITINGSTVDEGDLLLTTDRMTLVGAALVVRPMGPPLLQDQNFSPKNFRPARS